MTVHALVQQPHDRPARAPALLIALSLGWIALIAAFEALDLDRRVMALVATDHGFTLREAWWLQVLLHDDLRHASQILYALLLIAAFKPFGFLRGQPALERFSMLLGVTAALALVSAIKYFSLTSCPWDLAQFGGAARYVPLWEWGSGDGGPGRCFPSGHASAGFAFLPLALPMLLSGDAASWRSGWRLLALVLLFGTLCGAAQVLRGAHYPSHVLWSGFICWAVAVSNYGITRLAMPPGEVSRYSR